MTGQSNQPPLYTNNNNQQTYPSLPPRDQTQPQYGYQNQNQNVQYGYQANTNTNFTYDGCPINCNTCQTRLILRKKNGTFAWLMCLLLFWLTLCCFWIAFVVQKWKDTEYYCPKCNLVVYTKQGTC